MASLGASARAGEETTKAKQGTTKVEPSTESLARPGITPKCKKGDHEPPRDVTISAKEGVLSVDYACVGVWKDAPHRWKVEDLGRGYTLQIDLSVENKKKGPFKWNSANHPANPRRGQYEVENPTGSPYSTVVTTDTCDVPSGHRFNYTITLWDPYGETQIIDPGVMVVDGPLGGKP